MWNYSRVDCFLRRSYKDQFLALFLLNILISDLQKQQKKKVFLKKIMTEKLQSGKKNNVVSWTQKSHEHFNTAKSEIVNLQLQNIVRIYRT